MLSLETNQFCCAITDIGGLSFYSGKPEKAMSEFCRDSQHTLGYGLHCSLELRLSPFYIFSGVIKKGGKQCLYGQQFAAFIKKNKLGIVHSSPEKVNPFYSDGHTVKMWIWTPNVRALKAWWNKNGRKD